MTSAGLRALCIAVLAVSAAPPALAQAAYPSQTVKMMVPNPAGGLPDTVARIVGRRLQERLGQSVVIENRPGANGRIAVAALLAAPPDGYTLLVTDGAILTINPLLYANLSYNPKDILPIAMLARAPMFLAMNPKVPAASFAELIATLENCECGGDGCEYCIPGLRHKVIDGTNYIVQAKGLTTRTH